MIEKKKSNRVHWVRLTLYFLGFLAISIGLGFAIQVLLAGFHIPQNVSIWLALLIIFAILAIMNLSILPLPFGISIMIAAASHWNPFLVALAGSLGASLGEFSAYFFGYLGKRVAFNEDTPGYTLIRNWIQRYGMWAIAFLSFQPVFPFEIGGFIAGVWRMPVSRFLPALWIGKFPKYLIIIFLGKTILHFFHHGF